MEILDETLHFSQDVAAGVGAVWRAYADLEQRVRWCVPAGDGIVYDEHDFSPGGVDRFRCGPPGELPFSGEERYLHIEPEAGFVCCGSVRHGGSLLAAALVTWRLHDLGAAGTRVMVTDQVSSLVGSGMIDGHRTGHTTTLAQLAESLRARE